MVTLASESINITMPAEPHGCAFLLFVIATSVEQPEMVFVPDIAPINPDKRACPDVIFPFTCRFLMVALPTNTNGDKKN